MSKVSYEIVRKDERLFFYDGKQYVLFDSWFATPKGIMDIKNLLHMVSSPW